MCWDNIAGEPIWSTFKTEFYDHHRRDGKTEGQDGLRGLESRNATTAAGGTAIETADGRNRVASCCTAWPTALRELPVVEVYPTQIRIQAGHRRSNREFRCAERSRFEIPARRFDTARTMSQKYDWSRLIYLAVTARN